MKLLLNADCLSALKTLDENSLDSLVTDPPAGISFMNKEWDKPTDFILTMTEIYKECLRVLRPGAHGLVWAIPRTSHWTATALDQAGFEIRDVITHIFGSGFPKSLDVSKAIDKMQGAERIVAGPNKYEGRRINGEKSYNHYGVPGKETLPATHEAKQWQGFGTALKPASEHWVLIRKPLGESTVAKNVLKHGTGALNIDESRITISQDDKNHRKPSVPYTGQIPIPTQESKGRPVDNLSLQGRFPANLVLSHNEDCSITDYCIHCKSNDISHWDDIGIANQCDECGHRWDGECTEGCAVKALDEQSGMLKSGALKQHHKRADNSLYGGNSLLQSETKNTSTSEASIGGASRFFYCAKASKRDRNEGLEGMPEALSTKHSGGDFQGASTNSKLRKSQNHHPTVKATKLMEYLIKLITPPNGTVLDPFMGSGSTGVAAKRLGFEFIGIEREEEYFAIAEKRING